MRYYEKPMLQRHYAHEQAIAVAMMFDRPFSVVKLANNGSFELACTYNNARLLGDLNSPPSHSQLDTFFLFTVH